MQNPGTGTRFGVALAVSCEELTYSYPGSERSALTNVSFELGPGEYVGPAVAVEVPERRRRHSPDVDLVAYRREGGEAVHRHMFRAMGESLIRPQKGERRQSRH